MKHFMILKVFLLLFFTIPNLYSQDSYNIFTLEHFKKSVESLLLGDYDNAIIESTNVLRRDPNSSVAFTIRARAYYEKGVFANAIADCTQALSLDRSNVSAYSIRANSHVKNGDLNRAITDWRAILRINPECSNTEHNIEMAQQQLQAR
jgi:tetratricopeptide (TPR) repeat protein